MEYGEQEIKCSNWEHVTFFQVEMAFQRVHYDEEPEKDKMRKSGGFELQGV